MVAPDIEAGKWEMSAVHIQVMQLVVGVMSPTSPLGSALLGAKPGDVVEYAAPNGKLKVKVLETQPQ